MIYTDKYTISEPNPKHTGTVDCKLPTHEMFKTGKYKDGTPSKIKIAAGWNKIVDGKFARDISWKFTDTNVGKDGKPYSGYCIVKDLDIPSDKPAFQKAKTDYNNMDHIQ